MCYPLLNQSVKLSSYYGQMDLLEIRLPFSALQDAESATYSWGCTPDSGTFIECEIDRKMCTLSVNNSPRFAAVIRLNW